MVAPKREKMACQRSMTPKKRKGVAMSQKKRQGWFEREKTIASRSKPHPSIHPLIHLPWILSFTSQYIECKYALFLSYLELHKGFLAVGKTEGRYCPGEDNKIWVPRESHLGDFAMFSKIFQSISKWIADLWASKYYSMHRSNSQKPKTRRQLRSPMKD